MHPSSKNSIQQRTSASQLCIICLHLAQRFLSVRFFIGLFTGIIFTTIIHHLKEPLEQPKFRPDQSKFEYEKNQLPIEDINNSESSIWNNSWDG